jgi:hypothetical protein
MQKVMWTEATDYSNYYFNYEEEPSRFPVEIGPAQGSWNNTPGSGTP